MKAPELELTKVAASRFADREPAKPKDARTQLRADYLGRQLTLDRARLLSTAAETAGTPGVAWDTIRELSRERIIGSSDLLDINYFELAIAISRAVARIQLGNEYGTGFLVGPGLLMTNHHVLHSGVEAGHASAQFDYQDNAAGEMLPTELYRLAPDSFFWTDEGLDVTISGVAGSSARGRALDDYPWVRLIATLGKADVGDPINIIQHPRGQLKQIAFRKNEILSFPNKSKDFLFYTTDTEPGSSGSPCFNDQWELVALHHSGVPKTDAAGQILRTDGQPWRSGVDPDGLIQWEANEGVRISAIVTALRAAALRAEWTSLRDRMLDQAPPNPVELSRRAATATPSGGSRASTPPVGVAMGSAAMGQSYTWTIPIQVTIAVGGALAPSSAERPATVLPPTQPDAGGEEAVVIDPDWSNRAGYDPDVLGVSIPLPALSAKQKADSVEVPAQYRKHSQKYALHYHHYSVAMNKSRRTAWFSAATIDGENFIDFKRGSDTWFLDPRIPSTYQMGEELYAAANTDRGHLTRFKDLSWGKNKAEAVKATNDSFHFTNCTLQLAGFNEGKSRWQGLELFLLEQHAKKDERRMVVITGPVLADGDPLYKNKFMTYSTRIPLAFWKVCCLRRQDGTLAATGFKLGQEDITHLPGFEEKFDVDVAQVTIAEIEQLTGLDFGVLGSHDHFAAGGAPGTLEVFRAGAKRRFKPLETFDDIVV